MPRETVQFVETSLLRVRALVFVFASGLEDNTKGVFALRFLFLVSLFLALDFSLLCFFLLGYLCGRKEERLQTLTPRHHANPEEP